MHKKILIVLFFVFWAVPTFAQVDTAWVRRYNGPGNENDRAYAIAVDGLGNVYVTGNSYGGANYDYATIKYYPYGDTAWVRRYNGAANGWDGAFAIAVDGSGNVYVTGYGGTIKYDADGNQIWIGSWGGYDITLDDSSSVYVTGGGAEDDYVTVKYDSSGNELWVRTYNGPANLSDCAVAIGVDSSGNVYVTGRSVGEETNYDYATIKYDPNGTELWARRYNGPGNDWDFAKAIAVDVSGNVYVTGDSRVVGYDRVYATVKYSPNGNEVWVREYDGCEGGQDTPAGIALDDSGNVHVTGMSCSGYATIKYDPNGNELWVRRYYGSGPSTDFAIAIAVDDSSNVYVTGRSSGIGTGMDYASIKYDQNGNELWVERYNGPGNGEEAACGIAVDSSGNVYVTGRSVGEETNYDYATIKYSPSTCYTVSNVTICGASITDLGDGRYMAQDSVRIGDETGENYYLYLGDSAEVTFNVETGTVENIVFGNVHLSAKGEDYEVDAIASLTIDAQAGEVNFEGTVHYSDSAIFQNSFTGACTLLVNQDSLYGTVQFDDSTFGTIGLQAGGWNLDGCPFFGIHFEIDTHIPLTDLSLLDGEITLGVFPNTGIFRVGLTNGVCEYYNGAFGLDLTGLLAPPGVPSQGTIDIDFQNWRINVVDDIPIGIPTPGKPDQEEDSHSLGDTERSVEYVDKKGGKKIIVDLGMTIKGEEDYEDLNCNGRYDEGEPFEDENSNGVWDPGTNIELKDEFQNPVFNIYGHATIDLSLFHYVHFTLAESQVSFRHPDSTLSMRNCYGLALGNIFNIDLVQDTFYLNIPNKTYYGSGQFRHPHFLPLIFSGDLFLKLDDPKEFSTSIGNGFEINGFINFIPKGSPLRLIDNSGFFTDSMDVVVYDLISTTSKTIIDSAHMKGTYYEDFTIGDFITLSYEEARYFVKPDQCLSVTASIRVCPPGFILCVGGWLNFRVCEDNWSVNIGGIWVEINCPVNVHVYDSQGRHTGINQYGGVDTEIPGSEFYVFGDSIEQLIFLPDPDLVGGYTIDVEGLTDSVFDFNILYPNKTDGNAYNVGYFEEPTQEGALHRVNLDVNNNWTLLNDLDGDSIFESQTEPDSTAEAILDTTMVTITNVSSEILCANEANITWNTNVPATSEVFYRSENDSVYESVSDTTITTSHSVLIDDILTTDTYYYIVVSVDTLGNIASFLEKSFKLEYLVGDANGDGIIDAADVVYLINYLFVAGSPAPDPLEAGDANCDGLVDAADVVYLLNYLYAGGSPPSC